jgi:hypothetical protein
MIPLPQPMFDVFALALRADTPFSESQRSHQRD